MKRRLLDRLREAVDRVSQLEEQVTRMVVKSEGRLSEEQKKVIKAKAQSRNGPKQSHRLGSGGPRGREASGLAAPGTAGASHWDASRWDRLFLAQRSARRLASGQREASPWGTKQSRSPRPYQ